jgi:hypothetical protein
MATGVATAALIRKGDILAADGEYRLREGSVYSWLIDSDATYNITLYKSNYITFTRRTLFIIIANGEIIIIKGYRNILIDLLDSFILELFLLKNI